MNTQQSPGVEGAYSMKTTRLQFMVKLFAPLAAFLSIGRAGEGGFREVGYVSRGDDTKRLQASIDRCRREKQPFTLANGTYNLSGSLDFSRSVNASIDNCYFKFTA